MLNCHNQRQNLCWTGLGTSGLFLLTFEADYLRAAWVDVWNQQFGRGWGLVLFFPPLCNCFPHSLKSCRNGKSTNMHPRNSPHVLALGHSTTGISCVCHKSRESVQKSGTVGAWELGTAVEKLLPWGDTPEPGHTAQGEVRTQAGNPWRCRTWWWSAPGWVCFGVFFEKLRGFRNKIIINNNYIIIVLLLYNNNNNSLLLWNATSVSLISFM